jgi:hypothetical protein
MIFLHKTRAEAPTILLKAFAQAGKTPQILRADGEYKSGEIEKIGLEKQIELQYSNARQQFQNAPAETMVRQLTSGIRVSLRDANLNHTFWGYAAINSV